MQKSEKDYREHARVLLEDGETLYYGAWWFTKQNMDCDVGCCFDHFVSTEDALDTIERLSDGDWDKVWT